MVAGDIGSERPDGVALRDFLQRALQSQAEQESLRACGICLNVGARLPGYADKVDAICCQIEHVDGRAFEVFVPFRKGFLGRLKFDRPITLPGEPIIFRKTGGTG
jgi:hypothetical protein